MLLTALLLLAAPADDDVVKLVFPKPDPKEKVVKVQQTATPTGLVVAIAHDAAEKFTSSITFALLDVAGSKVSHTSTVSMNTKAEGPFFATELYPPVVVGSGHLFHGRVGTMSDGMGARFRDVYFTVLNRQLVKVLDVSSQPWLPTGPGGTSQAVTLTVLTTTRHGLPDLVESRRIEEHRVDKPNKRSLSRKLWRFDGAKYVSRATGDVNVAWVDASDGREDSARSWSGLQAVDGVPETAWATSFDDPNVTLTLSRPARLAGLVILAGCAPWPANPRVRKLWVSVEGEDDRELELADVTTEQTLPLTTVKPVSQVTLQVAEAWPGSDDGPLAACISELRVLTR